MLVEQSAGRQAEHADQLHERKATIDQIEKVSRQILFETGADIRRAAPLPKSNGKHVNFFPMVELFEWTKDKVWLAKMSNALSQHRQRKSATKKSVQTNGSQNIVLPENWTGGLDGE